MKLEVALNNPLEVEAAIKLLTGWREQQATQARPEDIAESFINRVCEHHGNMIDELKTPTPAEVFAQSPIVPLPPAVPQAAPKFADAVTQPTAPTVPQHSTLTSVDSEGLPWDARIHASTKTKTQDGKWKKARGVDDAYVENIKRELIGQRDGQMELPLPVPPAPTQGDRPPFSVAAYAEGLVPKVTMEQCVTALTHAADMDAPTTFEQLMPRLTAAVTGGTLQASRISEACLAQGLPSIVALQARPDLVAAVWADLGMP